MILVKAFGFCLLTALLIGKTIVNGNMYLQPGSVKAQEFKTPDKRVDNYRVPVDTSFDPNFWPTRGRRGGGTPEPETWISPEENLISNNYQCMKRFYLADGDAARYQKPKDFENGDVIDYNPNPGDKQPEDCYDLPRRPGQTRSLKICKTKQRKPERTGMDANDLIWLLANKTEGKRHKQQQQQKYQEVPSWLSSGYLLMKPDSSNGGKEKKEDVFWVARGKKSFK